VSLYFCNFYPSRVWVAPMWYDPLCGEGLPANCWQRHGWFSLWPITCKKVLPNKTFPDVGDDLSDINRYYCYFAIADDGAKWSGPYVRGVTNSAFHRCDCIGYTQNDFFAGFRLFDIDDNDDYTIILTS
jgi:hypothetical protein